MTAPTTDSRSRAPAITGVPGDVTAFLGVAARGPLVTRAPLTSLAQFEAAFGHAAEIGRGGDRTPNYLWHAARGFFGNGGKRLHVARVARIARSDRVDEAALSAGLRRLAMHRDVSLLGAPGIGLAQGHARLCALLLQHCEAVGHCFAILDAPADATPGDASALREQFDSPAGALYYPLLVVSAQQGGGKKDAAIPASGHLAGLYADCDDQPGTHKAPANLPVEGAIGVAHALTNAEHERLGPQGVNCLRTFPGRDGVWAWGARTLARDEWNFVAVRRYVMYLERSVETGLAGIVRQAFGEALWQPVREAVDAFLYQEWRAGALMGSVPDEAYFVHCDRTTMTQADIDAGRIVVLIGVALLKPAEFVIVRITLPP